jgi:two-component system response regulator AtoC
LERERFDCALFDIRMPHVDGVSLLAHCRRARPGLPVVLMTAYASVEQAVEMMRLGADYYLSKPFSPETLRATLARVVQGSQSSQEPGGAGQAFLTEEPDVAALLERALVAADSEASVLVRGESGTGKELLARYVHRHSRRSRGPFEVLNSAAMPETLVEAMLFGYEKGAFTGAVKSVPGKVETAAGGTLFLDEVGDMSLPVQSKVLRVLQDRTFQRIGDPRTLTADVRYVFATHRDLRAMIAERAFREDLFYRISVVEIAIPPLRQRPKDVALLSRTFLERFAAQEGKAPPALDGGGLAALLAEPWPGNVRQLQNFCRRAVLFGPAGGTLDAASARALLHPADGAAQPSERDRIRRALDACGGNVSKAAAALGVSRQTLYNRMKKWGLGPA